MTTTTVEGVRRGRCISRPSVRAAALGMNLVDTLTHGWDIAIATGQNSELPPDAAAAALTSARVIVTEQFRAFAGFAPAAQTDEGASPTDQRIAFVGRKPRSAHQLPE